MMRSELERGPSCGSPGPFFLGRREAFFTSALSKAEQKQLNGLLRKLMLAFEATEVSLPSKG